MYQLFVCKRLYVVGSNWPGARLTPWPHTGGNLGPGIENRLPDIFQPQIKIGLPDLFHPQIKLGLPDIFQSQSLLLALMSILSLESLLTLLMGAAEHQMLLTGERKGKIKEIVQSMKYLIRFG